MLPEGQTEVPGYMILRSFTVPGLQDNAFQDFYVASGVLRYGLASDSLSSLQTLHCHSCTSATSMLMGSAWHCACFHAAHIPIGMLHALPTLQKTHIFGRPDNQEHAL